MFEYFIMTLEKNTARKVKFFNGFILDLQFGSDQILKIGSGSVLISKYRSATLLVCCVVLNSDKDKFSIKNILNDGQ